MDREEIKNRSNHFAHKCVKLALALPQTDLGGYVRNQLLSCVTSAASNCRLAYINRSKTGFISRINSSVEKLDLCCFWLQFAMDEGMLAEVRINPLLDEAKQLATSLAASLGDGSGLERLQ